MCLCKKKHPHVQFAFADFTVWLFSHARNVHHASLAVATQVRQFHLRWLALRRSTRSGGPGPTGQNWRRIEVFRPGWRCPANWSPCCIFHAGRCSLLHQ